MPIVHTCTTTRTTGNPVAIASLSSGSGKLRVTTSSAHGIEDKDICKLAGILNLPQTRTRVSVISSTVVDCLDITYSSSYTLQSGTIQRDNQGVHVRAVVTALGKQVVLVSSVFSFDVAPFLASVLKEQAHPTPALNSVSNSGGQMACTYSVQLKEWGLNAQGVPEAYLAAGSTVQQTGLQAYMPANPAEYFGQKSLNLIRQVKVSRFRPVYISYAFNSSGATPGFRVIRYTGGNYSSTNYPGDAGSLVLTIALQVENNDWLVIYPTVGGNISGNAVYIYPNEQACVKPLSWQNRNGAREIVELPELEVMADVAVKQYRKTYALTDSVGERVNVATVEVSDISILESLAEAREIVYDGKQASIAERKPVVSSRDLRIQTLKIRWIASE
jgi:hypothetical protein